MRAKSLLLRLPGTILITYLLGMIVGGIGLGWIAVHPPMRPLTEAEESKAQVFARGNSIQLHDVALTTVDGVILRAWFLRPEKGNGDAAILLHGVSDNRLGMSGYGGWLARNGYAVLLPDARGHGLSDGLASYGVKEAEDIHRWVNWLAENDHPHCVYGLGESMGAAQLLQSLPKEPRFCAAVAESPFATFREVAYARFGRQFHTGPWLGETLFRPAVDIGFIFVRLRYGLNMETASPADAVAGSNTPVLLIHGMNDENIPPFHSDEIQARNPANVILWKVPGAVHTGAHAVAPEEFEQKVLGWFAQHRKVQSD